MAIASISTGCPMRVDEHRRDVAAMRLDLREDDEAHGEQQRAERDRPASERRLPAKRSRRTARGALAPEERWRLRARRRHNERLGRPIVAERRVVADCARARRVARHSSADGPRPRARVQPLRPARAAPRRRRSREEIAATLDAPFDWDRRARRSTRASPPATPRARAALRRLRRRVFLHTLLPRPHRRARRSTKSCDAITTLAERRARGAPSRCTRAQLAAAHGEPIGAETGAPQQLIVIGMGKLGGGELNVSSDIDLVFVYPEEGETAGPRAIANREFFDRLGRRVIAALHDVTADGYVFRVDMRLRPYGDSGPLTDVVRRRSSTTWSRRAARGSATRGSRRARSPATRHDELDALVTPFVFRKYLDYDAYEGLRDLHRQIREQERAARLRAQHQARPRRHPRDRVHRAGAADRARRARAGAARARHAARARRARRARAAAVVARSTRLRDAYVFLRNVEHRLQYRDDQQTQQLPRRRRRSARCSPRRWTATTSPPSSATLARASRRRRARSSRWCSATPATPQTPTGRRTVRRAVGRPARPTTRRARASRAAGFDDPAALLSTLRARARSARYAQLPALSRQRFDALVPQLLAVAATQRVAGADRASRVRAPARAARGGRAAQRLSRAADRASAAAAAPRAT